MTKTHARSGDPQERSGGEDGSASGPFGRLGARQRTSVSSTEGPAASHAVGSPSSRGAVSKACDGGHSSPEASRRWQKKAYPGEVFPLPSIFVEPAPRRNLARRNRQKISVAVMKRNELVLGYRP